MPRDQETTSVDQAPSTSRYPFGSGDAGPDDTAVVDDTTVAGRHEAAADDPDRDAYGGTGETPGTGESSMPPAEGEWVAGSRGPSVMAPSQPGQPAAEDIHRDQAAGAPAFGEPASSATGLSPAADTGLSPAADTTPADDADIDPAMATPPAMDADASPATGTRREDPAPPTDVATGSPAGPAPAKPGSAGAGLDALGAAFVTDADGYRASWVRIQGGFVDDPQGSVREAADLIAQITSALVSAVEERARSLRGGWEGGDADTEVLRNALREYRSFFERLMKV